MRAYWDNLNERERWMLGSGVVICFCYLLYLLIFSPLFNAVHKKSQQLVEKQETLVWMQQVRTQKIKKAPLSLSTSKLLTVLADRLNQTSFKQYPYQLQQTGVSDIQLVFDQVPYNPFVSWLWDINEQYAIAIKQLIIDRTETAGVVKLIIVIATK